MQGTALLSIANALYVGKLSCHVLCLYIIFRLFELNQWEDEVMKQSFGVSRELNCARHIYIHPC